MKISFDYDDTLSKPEVEIYAKELIDRGYEVHIVTSRYDSVEKYSKENVEEWQIKNLPKAWNNLFIHADIIGIKEEHIHFTNKEPKSSFFKENPDFGFHLDNDVQEWESVNRDSKVICVHYFKGSLELWRDVCEMVLRYKITGAGLSPSC